MTWILLSLTAPLFWTVSSVLDKVVVSRFRLRPMVPLTFSVLIDAIAALFIIFAHGGWHDVSVALLLWALLGGITYNLMLVFYFWALRHEEVSRIAPLFYTTPIFIAVIAGLTIGEVFSLEQYLGVGMLVAGAILVSARRPFSWRMHRVFWFMLLSSISLAVNQVITKHLLGSLDFWTVFALIRISSAVVLVPFVIRFLPVIISSLSQQWKKVLGTIVGSEVVNIFGAFFITAAAAGGAITLVNAFASVQPLYVLIVTVILSLWFPKILHEEIGKKTVGLKFAAIIFLFLGGLLIR